MSDSITLTAKLVACTSVELYLQASYDTLDRPLAHSFLPRDLAVDQALTQCAKDHSLVVGKSMEIVHETVIHWLRRCRRDRRQIQEVGQRAVLYGSSSAVSFDPEQK